ncbi:i-spanin [Serratia phage Slocum]|nr:i-spanin [Serratia phage Slocum]
MVFLTSFLSAIWNVIKKPQVLVMILILALIGTGSYFYSEAIDNNRQLLKTNVELTNAVKIARNNYDVAVAERDSFRDDLRTKTALLNAYQSFLGDNQMVLDAIRIKMEKDKKREDVVAKKPGLVTKQTKKSYNSLEDNFSCISGNMESCVHLESSSRAVQPKNK